MGFHWLPFPPSIQPLKDWLTQLEDFSMKELWLQWPEDFPDLNEKSDQAYLVFPIGQPHLAQSVGGQNHAYLSAALAWARKNQIPVKCIDWPMSFRFSPDHLHFKYEGLGFHTDSEPHKAVRAAWMAQHLQSQQNDEPIGVVGEEVLLSYLQRHWKKQKPYKKPKKIKVKWLATPKVPANLVTTSRNPIRQKPQTAISGFHVIQQLMPWFKGEENAGRPFNTKDLQDTWLLAEALAELRGKTEIEAIDYRDAAAATWPYSEKKLPFSNLFSFSRHEAHASISLEAWLWHGIVDNLAPKPSLGEENTLQVSAHLPHDQNLRKWLYRGVLLGLCELPQQSASQGLPTFLTKWRYKKENLWIFDQVDMAFATTYLERRLYELFGLHHGSPWPFSPLVWEKASLDFGQKTHIISEVHTFEEALEWMWYWIWKKQSPPTRLLPILLYALEEKLKGSSERACEFLDIFLGVWEQSQILFGQVLLRRKLWEWSQDAEYSFFLRGQIFSRWLSRTPEKDWPQQAEIFRRFSAQEARQWVHGLLGAQPILHAGFKFAQKAIQQEIYAHFIPWLPVWHAYFSTLTLSAEEEEQLWHQLPMQEAPEPTSMERWAAVFGKKTESSVATCPEIHPFLLQHLLGFKDPDHILSSSENQLSPNLSPMEARSLHHAMALRAPQMNQLHRFHGLEKTFKNDFSDLNQLWKKLKERPEKNSHLVSLFHEKVNHIADQWHLQNPRPKVDPKIWSKKKEANRQKIDLYATLKHNLGHFDQVHRTLIPRVWKYKKKTNFPPLDLWLCIDRSSSMQAVYPALLVMLAYLWNMKNIRIHLCLFDEEVIFLEGQTKETWKNLLRMAPEGKTNVGKALSACLLRMPHVPSQFWLWSDFRDVSSADLAFKTLSTLQRLGIGVGFAYPAVPGSAMVHQPHVDRLRDMQIPCFRGPMHTFPAFWSRQSSVLLEG